MALRPCKGYRKMEDEDEEARAIAEVEYYLLFGKWF